MKIKEILNEGGTGSLSMAAAKALPSTFVLPALKNQDAYLQYRMAVAMAAARSGMTPEEFAGQGAFGENMAIIGYANTDEETIKLALKLLGKEYGKGFKMISTKKSEEATDIKPVSPVAKRKPNKYGV